MDKENAEYIREHVSDLFSWNLSCFDFDNIIDCSTSLTFEEKEWAKKNLDWKIYILDI
jgi:hypothetical protein